MKVGILTFHSAYNYGAVLQCYALYKTIESLNHDVSIINYRPGYLATPKPSFGIRSFLRHPQLKRWGKYAQRRKFYNGFDRFISQNMKMSTLCMSFEDIKDIVNNYDFIILGSDQVWNRQYNGFDKVWYGGFGNVKWIGYAPSAGDCLFHKKEIELLKNQLVHYVAVSARENILSQTIQESLGINVPVVLDPSLLANPNIWKEWEAPQIDNKYIIVYQARESDDVIRIAEHIASTTTNCRIVPLDNYPNISRLGYQRYVASPSEFISLIKNAYCVVTTSFHATAFSVILGTPFYTIRLNDGADARCENLLDTLNLRNRMIDKNESPIMSQIDFEEVQKRIDVLRQQSMNFLKNSFTC